MECKHGQLARSCEICERDAEIASLTAELAEVKAERGRLRVECEAWRDEQLKIIRGIRRQLICVGCRIDGAWAWYDSVTAAVDALMAEREVEP